MFGRLSHEELASLYDESREKMPQDERALWLNQRLAKQVRFAYDNATAIKANFDKSGVSPSEIRTVADLDKIPVTTKDELVKLHQAAPPFGGFLAVPLNDLKRIYVSPGPIYDAWGPERIRAQVRTWLRSGCPKPGDVVLVSMSYHMVPAGMYLSDALDLLGCTVVPAGTGQIELQVKLLYDLQATAILAFPSFVMTVLKKAEDMGYDVKRDLNLKYVIGGGERHGQMLKKTFEEQYGLMVDEGFGTADVGPVAYACGQGGYHYDDEVCVLQIVDPDTGKQVGPQQVGEVVVTLFSDVYPLVRFGTGDLASYTDEPCPCGRTAPRITRILGMIGDHIRAKGLFIHLRELEEALSGFQQVSNYQMVISLDGHKDKITLRLEADDNKGVKRYSNSEWTM